MVYFMARERRRRKKIAKEEEEKSVFIQEILQLVNDEPAK